MIRRTFYCLVKMKIVLALFCLYTVASAAELYERRLLGNHLEDLVTETLEYVRSLLNKHDPYTLPPMPDQHLVDKDIDLVFSTSDVQIYKSNDFIINEVKVNPTALNSHCQVTIPAFTQQGNYKISGTAWGRKVEGSGAFKMVVTNDVQTVDVQYTIVDYSLQIQDLNCGYSVENVVSTVDGLEIEGLTKDEVNNLLNQEFLKYINDNKPFVSARVSAHLKEVANNLLRGHSLADVIAFLEKLVASTPDPPPFTFAP